MIPLQEVDYPLFNSWETEGTCSHHKKMSSDNIYTLDIEVSSLFKIGGVWQPFIYDDSIKYDQIEHAACPYIWQFGVNGHVIYGREFLDLKKVLQYMADPLVCKYIYIFNLSYEMGFLLDVIGEYHIEKMTARDIRKPIEFYVRELNIYFRCAFMLTNMKLENAAKEYTDVEKDSGEEFDYNVARSPLTVLTEKQLHYAEMDIIALWKIVAHFREEYGHVAKIPLTSTSIVRRALKDRVDFWYLKRQWDLVPEPQMFLREMSIFQGGYTHANVLHSGKLYTDIGSVDEASEYPKDMLLEMYPKSRFIKCRVKDFYEKRATHAFFIKVKFTGVKSKFYNHFLSKSKAIDLLQGVTDNGRIARCEEATYWLTDIDFDVITSCYNIKKIEILECYKAVKDYLDIRVIQFILELYGQKTGYKGLKDAQSEAIYKSVKPKINGLYGMSARNVLKELTEFNDLDDELKPNQWDKINWNDVEVRKAFIEKKLEESKKSYSTLFQYVIGCWVSAYARRNIFMTMTGHIQISNKYNKWKMFDESMDRDSLYSDTDSIKFRNPEKHMPLIQAYNRNILEKYKDCCERYPELDIEQFMPKDRFGIKHPVGFFEYEGKYKEFITLGAKKYAYRDEDGLHITVSGVAKSGAAALKDDIREFKNGFKWGVAESGKLVHYYNDDQQPFTFKDVDGNNYTCTQKHTVTLQPTSYTLGLTDWYEYLLKVKNREGLNFFQRLTYRKMKSVDQKETKGMRE